MPKLITYLLLAFTIYSTGMWQVYQRADRLMPESALRGLDGRVFRFADGSQVGEGR